MLRGSDDLIKVCRHRIHHDPFHVSADGDFSWEEVECLGACVNAPMVLIWNDTYEDLTAESFGAILDDFAAGRKPKPGPQIDRQFSAPIGGDTTLTDGSLYAARSQSRGGGAPVQDDDAKKPGEPANRREAPVPKPPEGDSGAGADTTRRE
jgi:NADH-quinone oxidoreductase subunit E